MPPLQTAQAVPEVVTEEYRILESMNCELATFSPADWVCLFETRFSSSVEHLRQRFPQGTGSLLSLLTRVPSGILASLALCLAIDCVRDHSPWSPRQVALGAGLGQLPAVWGSLRVKLRWFGPPPSTRVLLLIPHFCLWPLFRTCEAGSFFCNFFSSVWTCRLTRSLTLCLPLPQSGSVCVCVCVTHPAPRSASTTEDSTQLSVSEFLQRCVLSKDQSRRAVPLLTHGDVSCIHGFSNSSDLSRPTPAPQAHPGFLPPPGIEVPNLPGSVHTLICCTHIFLHIARALSHLHIFMRVHLHAWLKCLQKKFVACACR